MRDLYSSVKIHNFISPISLGPDGSRAGATLTMKGYRSLVIVWSYTLVNVTTTPWDPNVNPRPIVKLKVLENNVDFFNGFQGAEASSVLGNVTTEISANPGVTKVGYIGDAKYVNVFVEPQNTNTTPASTLNYIFYVSAVGILGGSILRPTELNPLS